jgi:hypothetical protein
MVAGWEGEELIEAAVVGEEVFLDELFSGEVELRLHCRWFLNEE